jgi:2'-5' RNA ligase
MVIRPFGQLKPDDKVFFAVLPDEPARKRVLATAVGQELRHGRPTYRTPERCYHLTLGGVGLGAWMDSARLAAVAEAAGRVEMRAFVLELNRVEGWAGPSRPWVLTGEDGLIGLCQLQERLRLALAGAGVRAGWAANFNPHLTLMRGSPDMAIEHIAPVRWTVREFVLVQSHVGEGRYTILGRWPLPPLVLAA